MIERRTADIAWNKLHRDRRGRQPSAQGAAPCPVGTQARFLSRVPAKTPWGLRAFLFLVIAFSDPSTHAESSLLDNSPFLPSGMTATATNQPAPLELRSIVKDGGEYEFSVYDPAKKQSTWVRLKEPGYGFLVESFDAAHNAVSIKQGGQYYQVVLKDAKILPETMSTSANSVVAAASRPNDLRSANQLSPRDFEILNRLRKMKRRREASEGRTQEAPEGG